MEESSKALEKAIEELKLKLEELNNNKYYRNKKLLNKREAIVRGRW